MKNIFIALLFITFVEYSVSLVTIPQEDEIIVINGDKFILGFEGDRAITKCSYNTNKDTRPINYDVTYNENPESNEDLWIPNDNRSNVVVDFRGKKLCMLEIFNVNKLLAMFWKISATDNSGHVTTKNLKVEVVTKDIISVLPKSKEVYIFEGEAYSLGYVGNNSQKPTDCSVLGNKQLYISNSHRSYLDSVPNSGVMTLSSTGCRVIIRNASVNGPTTIVLTAYYKTLILYRIIFTINVFYKESVHQTPLRNTIYIKSGDNYMFGFSRNRAISSCYFSVDNLNERFFVETDADLQTRSKETAIDNFITYGQKGLCQVELKNATQGLNTFLKMTVAGRKENITSATFQIIVYDPVDLITENVDVYEGVSFVQYVQKYRNAKNCYLHHEDFMYRFGDNTNYPLITKFSQIDTKTCGFKIKDVTIDDFPKPQRWHLILKEEITNLFYGNTFNITVRPIGTTITTQRVIMGSSQSIECNFEGQKFCELYNPQNELVQRDAICNFFIKTVSFEDLGKWKCLVSSLNSMKNIEYLIDVSTIDVDNVRGFVEEADKYMKIGCSFPQETKIDACKMTDPQGNSYVLNEIHATSRYTSFETNLNAGKCSMEIETPLKYNELGAWTCEMKIGRQIFGSVIHTVEGVGPINTTMNLLISYDHPFTIECRIPFSSQNCYITSPNGDIFTSQETYLPQLGRCELRVDKNYQFKNGTWNCYFARPITEPSVKVDVNVIISHPTPNNSTVIVKQNESAEFLYRSGMKPIHACLFISPTKRNFYMQKTDKLNNDISYIGKGLERGECGIKISKIDKTHIGEWRYVIKTERTASIERISSSLFVIEGDEEAICEETLTDYEHYSELIIVVIVALMVILITATFVILKKKNASLSSGSSQENFEIPNVNPRHVY